MTVGAARADIPPAFTVADVPVDASAENAIAARTAALAQGEALAFHRLLERLTAPEDASRLPSPDAATLTNMVADYQVSNDHSSAVRYLATYTFRFNPANVRDYLQGLGIPFTELTSKPVVIVPVLMIGDASHLWDDPNPWRGAWSAQPGKSGLVPWVVPAGDIEDVGDFDLADVAHPTPDKLTALSGRYGGGDVVVALAVQSNADGKSRLAISLTRYNADESITTANADVAGTAADTALYQAGVVAAARALETSWKAATFSAPSLNDQTIELSVPVDAVADWGRVQSRLRGLAIIHQVSVDFMARHEVRVRIKYAGDEAALKIALAQQGLSLNDSDPYPVLTALPGAGATAPAPSPAPASQDSAL